MLSSPVLTDVYWDDMKFFNRIVTAIERIADLGGYFSGWLVLLMTLLIVVEIVSRYVLRQPFMVADEFSSYLLVAVSYLGTAYTWRVGGHVRITALVDRLPARVAGWIRLFGLIVNFAFFGAVSYAGFRFVEFSFRTKKAAPTLFHTPLQGPHLTVLIGFILLALILLIDTAKLVKSVRQGTFAKEQVKEQLG